MFFCICKQNYYISTRWSGRSCLCWKTLTATCLTAWTLIPTAWTPWPPRSGDHRSPARASPLRYSLLCSVADPDPLQETWIRIQVAKKIGINSHKNQPKLKYHMNNKLINYNKNIVLIDYYIFYRKGRN